MINTQIVLVLVALLSLPIHSSAKSEPRGFLESQDFLHINEAETRWGTQKFSAEKFKSGSSSDRAKMTVSLIQSNHLNGKHSDAVKAELGPFTGYFWSEKVPAYILEEGWTRGKSTWQLVCLLNDDGTVKAVRIHKNCCSTK
jgi:hypothetical protein